MGVIGGVEGGWEVELLVGEGCGGEEEGVGQGGK